MMPAMVDPFLPEPEKVAAIRQLLPATGAGIYLNTGSLGPLPAETVRALREIEGPEGRAGRGCLPQHGAPWTAPGRDRPRDARDRGPGAADGASEPRVLDRDARAAG